MNKSISLILILFLILISYPFFALDSIRLPDGKLLQIYTDTHDVAYLAKYLDEKIDKTFGGIDCDSVIPIFGNPKNLKIIILNSKNILIHDRDSNEMVIFDENGKLLKNVKQVKEMIKEKKYDISRLNKAYLLKALFKAAYFDIQQVDYELKNSDIQTLLSQGDIKDFMGRILNINISGDYADIRFYNKANGENKAQDVIEGLIREQYFETAIRY